MARAKKTDENGSPKKPSARSKSNGSAAVGTAEARTPESNTSPLTTAPSTTSHETRTPQPIRMTEEEVRARAYELYLQRHGLSGTPEEDWYRAEAELRGKSA